MTIQYKLEERWLWEAVKLFSSAGKATRKYSQNHYFDLIPFTLEQSSQHHCLFPKEETALLRGAVGKLNWIPGITQPEISFHVCEISTKMKNATIIDIISVNEVIKFTDNTSSHIKTPSFDLHSLEVQLCYETSFCNLPDGASQEVKDVNT